MKGWEVRYIESIERVPGIKSFRFERPDDFDFHPGQYFVLFIPFEERSLVHHFSFSSSPGEKSFFEFTTRIRDSEFKQTMNNLPVGSIVRIGEIHGVFTIGEDMKKVVFLCGGIGITAARSNILWAHENRPDVDIILLFANHNEESVPFKDELEDIKDERIRVVHILSKPLEGWKGAKGHMNAVFIKSEVPDYMERDFFISGPPAMVKALKSVITKDEVGVTEDRIITENFLGY